MDDFLVFFLIAGLVVVFIVIIRQNITAKRKRTKRTKLTNRFGPEYAQRIMDGEIFQGMTKEMLLESWGEPVDCEEEQIRSKLKQTWKYNKVGVNRYQDRVYLENDVVVGWKQH